jgi:aryl-alcohol dehydrogenase-like predicted oxidoreductase
MVPPLCLGGNVFGWTADEPTSFAILDAAMEAGITFIDTADVYSRWVPGHQGGESETVIGNWMKARGNRDKVILATKVGMDMGEDRKGLSAAYIRRAVEDSLRRLQTDRIDLYWSHRDDESLPVEEPLRAYDELVRAGKVRVIGASNYSAARLAAALDASEKGGLPRYEALQPEYNLYSRQGYEAELEPLCVERQVGCTPYYALAAGFLTGKYRKVEDTTDRARAYRVKDYINPRGLGILDALDAVAARHGAKPANVAVAWVMARPSITAPIASASRPEQVADLAAALRLKLSAEDLAELERASG